MHLYFAASPAHLKLLKNSPAKKILFSYAYIDDKSIEFMKSLDESYYLMIDSGAFTAWTKNKQVDIQKYIAFCKMLKTQVRAKTTFINLDVIPGEFGRSPSKEEVEISAQKGFDNMLIMLEAGVEVMHTFHMHEDFSWLKKIADHIPYIGISPANDASVPKRILWLENVFSRIKATRKTHLLGFTSLEALKKVPNYSCDAVSWLTPKMYGILNEFDESDSRTRTRSKHAASTNDHMKALLRKNDESTVHYNISEKIKMEEYVTRLWKARGIVWQD